MSQSLYFYRVSKINEVLPEIINTDRMELPYYSVMVEEAAEWEKSIGQIRTIEHSAVNMREVGEKLFGKKPETVYYRPNYFEDPDGPYAEVEMSFPDGDRRRVHRREVDKFRYNTQYRACIYDRETIASIDESSLVKSDGYEDRLLSRDEILEMAEKYVDEYEDVSDYPYYAVPLFEIMKMYFAFKDGDGIICCSV